MRRAARRRVDPAGHLAKRDSDPLCRQDRDAAGEELASLAQHGATMAIHLGVNHLEKILVELLPHYGADCPIAVIHRATWPDQDWVVGTLADIAAKVEAKGFRRTALILVGRVLGSEVFSESSLYRAGHAHLYRP